jgi:predicted RNA-binding Zn-ribbon protein involved in translation (DUF1610 family)
MINIKCRKCGYRLPFSQKIDGFTVRSRLKYKQVVCPRCGEILIKNREKNKE